MTNNRRRNEDTDRSSERARVGEGEDSLIIESPCGSMKKIDSSSGKGTRGVGEDQLM